MTTPVRPAPAVAPEQCPAPEPSTPITLTTPEAVARWLRTVAPEDVCGRPHMPTDCPLANYLNVRNGHAGQGASVDCDSYSLAGARYPLPAWAQLFVARVDHAPARWQRPAAQGLTAAEALRLLEGLCASRLDRLPDWIGSQEAPDGSAGPAQKDDGQEGLPTGAGPVDGGATPPWMWPLLSLPS
jgi:hypothetical protein